MSDTNDKLLVDNDEAIIVRSGSKAEVVAAAAADDGPGCYVESKKPASTPLANDGISDSKVVPIIDKDSLMAYLSTCGNRGITFQEMKELFYKMAIVEDDVTSAAEKATANIDKDPLPQEQERAQTDPIPPLMCEKVATIQNIHSNENAPMAHIPSMENKSTSHRQPHTDAMSKQENIPSSISPQKNIRVSDDDISSPEPSKVTENDDVAQEKIPRDVSLKNEYLEVEVVQNERYSPSSLPSQMVADKNDFTQRGGKAPSLSAPAVAIDSDLCRFSTLDNMERENEYRGMRETISSNLAALNIPQPPVPTNCVTFETQDKAIQGKMTREKSDSIDLCQSSTLNDMERDSNYTPNDHQFIDSQVQVADGQPNLLSPSEVFERRSSIARISERALQPETHNRFVAPQVEDADCHYPPQSQSQSSISMPALQSRPNDRQFINSQVQVADGQPNLRSPSAVSERRSGIARISERASMYWRRFSTNETEPSGTDLCPVLEATLVQEQEVYEATIVRDPENPNSDSNEDRRPCWKRRTTMIGGVVIITLSAILATTVNQSQTNHSGTDVDAKQIPSCVEIVRTLFETDCDQGYGCGGIVDVYGDTVVVARDFLDINFFLYSNSSNDLDLITTIDIDYDLLEGIAITNTSAVVGSSPSNGTAGPLYAYEKDHSGNWTLGMTILPSDISEGVLFGYSAAVDGNVMAVGAPFDGEQQEGSVYIYRHNENSWVKDAKLTPNHPNVTGFGVSVTVKEDTIIVGASLGSFGGGEGYVYVYKYDPLTTSWKQTVDAFTENACDTGFGLHVTLTRDQDLLVTCQYDKNGDSAVNGNVAVYYYKKGKMEEKRFILQQIIRGKDPEIFGNELIPWGKPLAIDSSGTLLAVAAFDHYAKVHFLALRNGVWGQFAVLANPVLPHFGRKVAFFGNMTLVASDRNVYLYSMEKCFDSIEK